MVFIEIPIFVRCADDLFSDEDIAELQGTRSSWRSERLLASAHAPSSRTRSASVPGPTNS